MLLVTLLSALFYNTGDDLPHISDVVSGSSTHPTAQSCQVHSGGVVGFQIQAHLVGSACHGQGLTGPHWDFSWVMVVPSPA